jgi:hypothetical protein
MLSRKVIAQCRFPRRLPMVLVVAAVAVPAAEAHAQATGDTALVLTQNGRVSLEHSGGELWALSVGQTVNSGQAVVTGIDGYAQLQLSDSSIIEVFPNSRLIFHPTRTNWKDLIDLYLGKVRLQIQHLTDGDSPYHVTSPTAVISIRGTVLDVEVDSTQVTTVQVENGLVSVRHRLLPGKEVNVGTGQTLRVVPSVPLAAIKGTSPLVVAGRVAKVAGDTLARIGTPGARSGGHSAPKGGSGTSSGGSSAGTNQPTPPPSQGGDRGNKDSGNNAPPGDVIH